MDKNMISKKTKLRSEEPNEPAPEDRIKALEARNTFLEDCMAEMAVAVYGV